MNTLSLYHAALTTHIIGLTLMAGTTAVNFVLFKQFWKHLAVNRAGGSAIYQAMSRLPLLFGIGFLLLVISGVGMMYITNGAFGEQTWFRIKFALILIIVINAFAFGRRQGTQLKKWLTLNATGQNQDPELLRLKQRLDWFQLVQMFLFLVIFALSVFKFN